MENEKRAGKLNRHGEAEYIVTACDVVEHASKAGVSINIKTAQEWLLDSRSRKGIETAIALHIRKRMLDL